MPTYIVSATESLLTVDRRKRIAKEITRAHSQATGAHGFFAQVIFNEIPVACHFMGSVQIDTNQVYVLGHIRAGRTEEQKSQLLDDIVASLHEVTGLERRYLWAYISELEPANMIEYGHVLPKPGTEAQWLSALSEQDREYVLSLMEAQ